MFEPRAMPLKATCFTQTWTEEEDVVVQEEADSDKDEADKLPPMKIDPTQ